MVLQMLFFSFGGWGEGGGVNKVYYGLCGNGEFSIFFSPRISHLDPPLGHGGLIFFFYLVIQTISKQCQRKVAEVLKLSIT